MANDSATTTISHDGQEMVDMVFDLGGSVISEDYPFLLWSEIVRILPWLKNEANAGILPLRGSASGENTLLSKRTKLILRIPAERVNQTGELSGQQLNLGDNNLLVYISERHIHTTRIHKNLFCA